jgi:hypothetical protein
LIEIGTLYFSPGWLGTMILSISAFLVAEITAMHHHAWLTSDFKEKDYMSNQRVEFL